MKYGFDLLWPAIIVGGVAAIILLVCFGYLTWENSGSRTFSLAAAALASALLVFGIQAYFELQPSETKTFITIEYTVDRSKPEIRQWSYGQFLGSRIHIETGASKVYTELHPGEIPMDDVGFTNIQRLMVDLAVVSTLSYLAHEQFDWQLIKVQYRGRRGDMMTLTSAASAPDQCHQLTSDAVRRKLERVGNPFAAARLFSHQQVCLPPGSQVELKRDAILIDTPLLALRFDFAASGSGNFVKPGGDEAPVLGDGKPQFVTSFVGLNVTTAYSRIRAQNRQMQKYKDWALRVVTGAQEWFENAP